MKDLPTTPHAATTSAAGSSSSASATATASESGIAAGGHPTLTGFVAGAIGLAFRAFAVFFLFLPEISGCGIFGFGADDGGWIRQYIARQGEIERAPRFVAGRWRRGLSPCRRGND
jgi:hypothetical protein